MNFRGRTLAWRHSAVLGTRLRRRAAIGDTRVNEALLSFLQDWLKHHILVEDRAYRPHAEHNPVAREAAKSFKATEVWWSRQDTSR